MPSVEISENTEVYKYFFSFFCTCNVFAITFIYFFFAQHYHMSIFFSSNLFINIFISLYQVVLYFTVLSAFRLFSVFPVVKDKMNDNPRLDAF